MIDSIYGSVSKINERSVKFVPSKNVILKDSKLLCDKVDILPNKIIKMGNVSFKCRKIVEKDGVFVLSECDFNKLSLLALPLVLNNVHLSGLIKPYLYNCYVNRELSVFTVIIRMCNEEHYMELEEKLIKYANYVDNNNLGNNLIAFNFNINALYPQIKRIMRGKYSRLLDKHKDIISNYHNNTKTIGDILYPTITARGKLATYLDVNINMIQDIISKPLLNEYYEEYSNK